MTGQAARIDDTSQESRPDTTDCLLAKEHTFQKRSPLTILYRLVGFGMSIEALNPQAL